jgi:hypothetical protein
MIVLFPVQEVDIICIAFAILVGLAQLAWPTKIGEHYLIVYGVGA